MIVVADIIFLLSYSEPSKQRKARSRTGAKKEPTAPVQPGMLRIMAPSAAASSENGGSVPATGNESQQPSNKKASASANSRSRGRGRGGERKDGKSAKQSDQDNATGPSEGKSRPRREPRNGKNDGDGRVCKWLAVD